MLGSHNDLDCHHSIHQPLKSLLLQRFQGVNGYFAEAFVVNPVQTVLDSPMTAPLFHQPRRIGPVAADTCYRILHFGRGHPFTLIAVVWLDEGCVSSMEGMMALRLSLPSTSACPCFLQLRIFCKQRPRDIAGQSFQTANYLSAVNKRFPCYIGFLRLN